MTMLYDRVAGLVSVIIPAYNYDKYIIDTLESLKRQTYSNIEIILIDDCSQDNTKDIVNKWFDENKDKFSDLVYLQLPRNLGFEWSVNIGLCLSKGEFIVFHDADDISHDEKIEKQLRYLQEHPDTAALGTVFSSFRDDISNIISTSGWISFDANEIERNYKNDIKHCVCYGTLMIRAYIIDEVIGFNKEVLFSNDFFFVSNIVNHDFIVENLNESLLFYRNHDKQFSRSLYGDDTVNKSYKDKRKKNEGLVSIILPIKGTSNKMKESLESIISQTYDNLELIIIDERPDNETVDFINKLAKQYINNDRLKDLVYLPLPREVGFPWVYNIGAYFSKGEFIAFHNVGGKSHPKKIEKQIEFLRNNFMYSVVGTNYNDSGNYIKFNNDIDYSYTVDFMPCMNFNTLLLRSEIIDKTGGMNKRTDGAEDFEFIFNLLHNGYRVENLPDILYVDDYTKEGEQL